MNQFRRLKDLKGQVAVITGGTGQVGFATAIRLAEQQARVICLVRSHLEKAKNKIKTLPNYESLQHLVLEASVTNSLSLNAAAAEVKQIAKRCDILINAAGISRRVKPENLEDLTDDIFDEIITTNLRGAFASIRAFAPLLKLSGNGLIVNISSTSSLRASQSNLAYSSSKAGLNILTANLAKALGPEIRVLAVSPGYLEFPTSGLIKAKGFNELQGARIPLKRIGEADDIASTIEACATTLRFATGTNLILDGGRTL